MLDIYNPSDQEVSRAAVLRLQEYQRKAFDAGS
jgi:hypothetical protein